MTEIELATPNKKSKGFCCTPIDQYILSPYLPQENQFYACMSPIQPVQVSYISPARRGVRRVRSVIHETSSSTTCDCINISTFQEKTQLTSQLEEHTHENEASTEPITKRYKKVNKNRIVRRRKRKNMEQLKVLYNEYKENSNWNKTIMTEIALKTGLTEAQIYKWSWDQKKKNTYN